MISGFQALQHLDQGVDSVRQEIDRINQELNRVSEALQANRRAQAQSLKQLAEIRLDEISQGSFIGDLDASDQRTLALLEKRQHAYTQLENDLTSTTEALKRLEQDRGTALEAVNAKAQTIIDLEHKIQAELEEDNTYQEKLQEARKLDSIADKAEEKAGMAEQDQQEKGDPYENDALFMYLWKRKYGTPDYKANALIRFLDRWVEKLCNYNQYRVNYWTLLEIPKRLRTHAEQARSHSDSALEALATIETANAQQAGLPALQEDHAKALQVVDGIDDDIERLEDKLNEWLKQRAQFAEAKDTYMEQSLRTLSSALNNKSIYELNDAAHKTVSTQDNLVVREVAEQREQHDDLKEELRDQRQIHGAKLDRLQQLESVRRQFKNRRFDDVRSGFGNKSLIVSMLGQFLNGLVNSSELWRVLERQQRHRDVGAWPDFGSGGLGLPGRRRSPWHFPSSRGRSGGGFRLPKSGGWTSRGGGGGFRTGGGF